MVDRGADSERESRGGGGDTERDLRKTMSTSLTTCMANGIPDPQVNPVLGPSETTCFSTGQSFHP